MVVVAGDAGGGVFVLQAVEADAGVEAVAEVAAFVADFDLVAPARFEQAAIAVNRGLRAVKRAVAGVEAVGFAEVPDDARIAGERRAVAFFFGGAAAALDLVMADATAADEREVFQRADNEFAVNACFVKGFFVKCAGEATAARAGVAEDVRVGQAAEGTVVAGGAERARPALFVAGFEVVVVGPTTYSLRIAPQLKGWL